MITYFNIMALIASSFFISSIDGTKQPLVITVNHVRQTPEAERAKFICNVLQFEGWIKAQGYTVLIGNSYTTHVKERYNNVDEEDWDRNLFYDRLDTDINILAPDGHILTTEEELRPFGEYWASLDDNNHWDKN